MATKPDYDGPERRVMNENTLRHINDQLSAGGRRFARIETSLVEIKQGHESVINRLDAQDAETRKAIEAAQQAQVTAAKTLAETKAIRELSENMQSAARFFNAVFGFFAAIGRWVHTVAKFLIPIVTVALLIWGAIWAVIHGGKPPTAP